MATEYDAIVVGTRCAGAPTAMLLAQRGYRVLAVDRAAFPSDALSSHFVHQPGVARLERWGLLGEVARSGCPPVRSMHLDLGPFVLDGSPPPYEGTADAYCIRRTLLDDILVRAASAAGAEVWQRFSVTELVTDSGQVRGVRGHTAGGSVVTERARVVIGADGVRSFVARAVDAPVYDAHPTLTCAYFTYWEGADVGSVELHPRPGQTLIAAPTNDGLTMSIALWPATEFGRIRCDVEVAFDAALDLVPALAERLRSGARAERIRGTGHLPNHFRRPYGPGWALVGDAGYHRDPVLALGITDAFRDAELLVDALDAGLSGTRTLPDALAGYERQRNELAAPGFAATLQYAALQPPPPEMAQLLAALRDQPARTDEFFGTVVGTFAAAEFFSPENIARIMGGAAAPAGAEV